MQECVCMKEASIIKWSLFSLIWQFFEKKRKKENIKKLYKSKTHGKAQNRSTSIITLFSNIRSSGKMRGSETTETAAGAYEKKRKMKVWWNRHVASTCLHLGEKIKLNQRAFSVLDRKQISQNYCWLADWLLSFIIF